MTPYERLLGDAIRGDAMLFVRQDSVEAAWEVVDPIVGNATPLHEYDPGTWGPVEADKVLASDGEWRNPRRSSPPALFRQAPDDGFDRAADTLRPHFGNRPCLSD
jgi:hypothetical protein